MKRKVHISAILFIFTLTVALSAITPFRANAGFLTSAKGLWTNVVDTVALGIYEVFFKEGDVYITNINEQENGSTTTSIPVFEYNEDNQNYVYHSEDYDFLDKENTDNTNNENTVIVKEIVREVPVPSPVSSSVNLSLDPNQFLSRQEFQITLGQMTEFLIKQREGSTDAFNRSFRKTLRDADRNTVLFTESLTALSNSVIGLGSITSFITNGTDGYVLQSTGTGVQWVATSSLGITGGGGGGGGSGTVNSGTTGQIAYYAGNGTTVSGTSTLDISSQTNLSVTATGLSLSGDSVTLTSGYNIPLTASTTNWNTFYDTPSSRITAGTGLQWSGNTISNTGVTSIGGLTGAVATSSLGITSSQWLNNGANIYFSTGNVGIGTSTPTSAITLASSTLSSGGIAFGSDINLYRDDAGDGSGLLRLNSPFIVGNQSQDNSFEVIGSNGNWLFNSSEGYYFDTDGVQGLYVSGTGFINNVNIGGVETPRITTDTTGIGFFGVTPVAKPGSTTDLRQALIDLGLYTTGGATPLNLNNGQLLAGSAGIGTTTPSAKLSVTGTAGTGDIFVLASSTNSPLFTVKSTGRVGIGTTTPGSSLTVSGTGYISGNTTIGGNLTLSALSDGCLEVSSGAVTSTGSNCGTGSGGVTNLNGLTASSQTFATSSDTNVGLNITSSGSIHTFTPTWTGTLSVARGGTGLSSYTTGDVLYASGAGTLAGTSTANLKTTLGLNNVENTALSTWAGSGNITSLGTITSGVWQGTAIGDAYITKTGDWTGTFDGQEGSYYLARGNHTGTQTASTISDFSSTARGLISSTATGLTYTSGTGVFSLTSGYNIPLTASTTNWNTFYDTPSNRITAGTGLSWSGNTLNSTGGTVNSGTTGQIAFYNSSGTTVSGTSTIFLTSNRVGIATTTPTTLLSLPASTTSVGGISLGGDVNIYRNGAGDLTIDPEDILTLSSNNVSIGQSGGTTQISIGNVGGSLNFNNGTGLTYDDIDGVRIFDLGVSSTVLGVNNGLASLLKRIEYNTTGIGFFGVTPVAKPGSTTDLRQALIDLGLYTTSGATPLNLNNGQLLAGSAGIGTTTPSAKLAITNSGTGNAFVIASSSNTPYVTVNSSGNTYFSSVVGIGTTTNNSALNIASNSASYESVLNVFGNPSAGGPTTDKTLIYASGSYEFSAPGRSLYGVRSAPQSTQNAFSNADNNYAFYGAPSGGGVDWGIYLTGEDRNYFSGRVGIATTTPGYSLTVAGDISLTGALRASGNAGTSGMVLQTTGSGVQWVATSSLGISGGGSGTVNSGTTGQIAFYNSSGTAVSGTSTIFLTSNSVGIGSTSPSARLAVSGLAGSASDIFAIASSSNSRFFTVKSTGDIGFNTQNPSYPIHLLKNQNSATVAMVQNASSGATSSAEILVSSDYTNGGLRIFSNDYHNSITKNQSSGPYIAGGLSLYTSSDGAYDSLTLGSNEGWIRFTDSANTLAQFADHAFSFGTTTTASRFTIQTSPFLTNAFDITSSTANYSYFRVLNNGRVGIGSSTPSNTLTVAGTGLFTGNLTTQGLLTVSGTGTSTISSNISITGDIIPTADNVYTLGSADKQWKDVYIGPGSLYINGQKVLEEDSQSIVVSADPDQNLIIRTEGTGDIELNPLGTGIIQLKGDVQLSAGYAFSTSNGSDFIFGDGLRVENLSLSGNRIIPINTNGSLELSATGTGAVYIPNGNLGIATTTPGYSLTVAGDISLTGALRASGNAGTSGMVLQTTGSGVQWVATSSLGISGGGSGTVNSGTTGQIAFYNSSGTAVSGTSTIFVSGEKVGIGTTTPPARLSLASIGNISSGFGIAPTVANGALLIGGGSSGIVFDDNQIETVGTNSDLFINANSSMDIIMAMGGGNVGIGTSTPATKLHIEQTSAASTREYLFKGTVSDGGNDAFYISNGTITDGRFMPAFNGYLDSTSGLQSLLFRGMTSSGNDTGTTPIVTFQAMRTSSATDPINATITDIATRPTFSFQNNATAQMTILANGNVGIGTTTPVSPFGFERMLSLHGTSTSIVLNSTNGGSGGSVEIIGDQPFRVFTNGTEKFRVSGNGNLGIGSTSPISRLVVLGDADSNSYINVTNSNGTAVRSVLGTAGSTGRGFVGTVGSHPFDIRTDNTARMTILPTSGYVGIGTTSPLTQLSIGNVSVALGTTNMLGGGLSVSTTSAIVLGLENRSASSPASGGAFGVFYSNDGVALSNGDRLGGVLFGGSTSASNLANTAGVVGYATENWVNGSAYGSRLAFETVTNATAGRTEKMTILGNGYVGIGTTSPLYALNLVRSGTGGDSAILAVENYSSTVSTDRAILVLQRARGTASAPVIVQNGDQIGSFQANAYQGSSFNAIAGINFEVDGTFTSGQRPPGRIIFTTTIANGSVTERMRIDDEGNVGIGSTSPVSKFSVTGTAGQNPLTIASSTNAPLLVVTKEGGLAVGGPQTTNFVTEFGTRQFASYFDSTNSSGYAFVLNRIADGSNAAPNFFFTRSRASNASVGQGDIIGRLSALPWDGDEGVFTGAIDYEVDGSVSDNVVPTAISFKTGTQNSTLVEALRISSGGSVAIGSTTPIAKLHVVDSVSAGGVVYFVNTNTSSTTEVLHLGVGTTTADTTNLYASFYQGSSAGSRGTRIGYIQGSGGTAVTYNTTSDLRLKDDIRDSEIGLDALLSVGVKDYKFINGNGERTQGFIAQDLYEIYPYAVAKTDSGTGALNPNSIPWGVDYGRLTPLLVKSIQDQQSLLGEYIKSSELDEKNIGIQVVSDERNVRSYILVNIVNKMGIIRDFMALSITALNGYFEEIYAERAKIKEIEAEKICLKNSEGEDVCITGDDLEGLLNGEGGENTEDEDEEENNNQNQDNTNNTNNTNETNTSTSTGSIDNTNNSTTTDNVTDADNATSTDNTNTDNTDGASDTDGDSNTNSGENNVNSDTTTDTGTNSSSESTGSDSGSQSSVGSESTSTQNSSDESSSSGDSSSSSSSDSASGDSSSSGSSGDSSSSSGSESGGGDAGGEGTE